MKQRDMKQQALLVALARVAALTLACAGCGKDKSKAAVVAEDAAGTAPVLKQDDALAAKLAQAYPKIRCALAAGQNAAPTLYIDAGFADASTYLKAFDVQAKANPAWARKVTSEALAKPCVEPTVLAAPPTPPAPELPTPGKTP